jgi:hypothetical protein
MQCGWLAVLMNNLLDWLLVDGGLSRLLIDKIGKDLRYP